MQKNKLNKLLSTLRVKVKADQGFTIVELLLSLSILFMILLVTPTVWSNINHIPHTERYAIQQFFHAATDEIQLHRVSEQDNNRIIITTVANDQIIISKYNDTIRRQVNGTGHEILLRDVNQFGIDYTDRYLLLQLEMKSGQRYEKIITTFTQ